MCHVGLVLCILRQTDWHSISSGSKKPQKITMVVVNMHATMA